MRSCAGKICYWSIYILIVGPQLVANLGGGFLLKSLFGNQAILMLVMSGVSMLIAAALSMWFVQESD